METTARRASPMSVEDRQSMIVDAVIPLLLEHGANITSRQIAEEAGVAEGTVFRAFGDKESLIRAAVERYFDPQPMRAQLAQIPQECSLRDKIKASIGILQTRFSGVLAMMSALGHKERPPFAGDASRDEYPSIIAHLLEPELHHLNLPTDRIAPLLRLVAFSSSIPQFNESVGFTLDELTDIVLYGIVGDAPSVIAIND
ncbi:MAG: TetR/AcrR family transcriptional regulator [Microbacteriaceae bacterium]